MSALIPPHSIAAEQAVLGGLMLEPHRLNDVSDWLKPGDFFRRDHALIFGAISERVAAGKAVDAVTLADSLADLNHLTGGMSYLVSLAQNTPSAANVAAHAEIVAEHSRCRRALDIGIRLADQAQTGRSSADVAAEAEAELRDLAPTSLGGLKPASIRCAYASFAERYEGRAVLGLETPWESLTRYHRFVAGEVTVLAARPSVGKSALAFQITGHAVQHGVRTALFSLEMPEQSVINRMLSCSASVPYDFIRAPGTDREEGYMARLMVGLRDLEAVRHRLLIDDSAGITASQIGARARREHLRSALGLVVVDHLHEVRMPGKQGEVIERGDALREMKRMAKELRVPVLCLAQLSRSGGTGAPPTLVDLRGAGGIEEVADTVILMHRPDYYDKSDRPRLIEMIIAKSRDGERATVNLLNDYRHMRALEWLGEAPARQEPQRQWGKKVTA